MVFCNSPVFKRAELLFRHIYFKIPQYGFFQRFPDAVAIAPGTFWAVLDVPQIPKGANNHRFAGFSTSGLEYPQ